MCSVAAAPFSPSAAGKAAKEAGSSSPENQFIRGTIGLHDKYMEYVQVRQAVQLLYTCSQSPQPPLVSPAHCTLVTKVPQKHSASTLYSNLVQRPQLPVVDSIPPSTLRLPSTLPAAALISALAFVSLSFSLCHIPSPFHSLQDSFGNSSLFHKALKEAFESFCNKQV
jgi:hypothetical protein